MSQWYFTRKLKIVSSCYSDRLQALWTFSESVSVIFLKFLNMSQKMAERNPKRMLVVYKEDMCTSILNIGKVKRILSGEAKLTE